MPRSLTSRNLLAAVPLSLGLIAVTQGCTTNEGDEHEHNYYSLGGAAPGGAGPVDDDDDEEEEEEDEDGYTSYLPPCTEEVDLADLEIDLFGKDGHRFYFEVTPEARQAGDEQRCNFGNDGHGAVYSLGDASGGCPLAALNVRVLPAGSKQCADTGEVEVDLPGQSSFKPWAEIPNIKLDVGEFQDELRFEDGERQLRFNNGQADSTIVREAVALRIWRALGYPAPKTAFVETRSNVWDTEVRPGAKASHVIVEPYKEHFFLSTLPEAVHVWEGVGDPFTPGGGGCGDFGCCDEWGCWEEPIDDFGGDGDGDGDVLDFGDGFAVKQVAIGNFNGDCQWSADEECDQTALETILTAISEVPTGPGYMAATADYIDWPMLHKNQCLSALTGTGDDWIHNSNNVVLVLLDNDKLMLLPYSTDISGNHPWYMNTPYQGYAHLTQACEMDPECWEAALSTCEGMIDDFEELDLVTTIVKERCEALEEAELDRPADAPVCEQIEDFYTNKPDQLRAEIDALRNGGGPGGAGGEGGFFEGAGGFFEGGDK